METNETRRDNPNRGFGKSMSKPAAGVETKDVKAPPAEKSAPKPVAEPAQ